MSYWERMARSRQAQLERTHPRLRDAPPPPPKRKPKFEKAQKRRKRLRARRMTDWRRLSLLSRFAGLNVVTALIVGMIAIYLAGWGIAMGTGLHPFEVQRRIVHEHAFHIVEPGSFLSARETYRRARMCSGSALSREGRAVFEELCGNPDARPILERFDVAGAFTAIFLHAGIGHLWMNMAAFGALAAFVAPRLGSLRFLALFLACGLAGNVAYWLINGVAQAQGFTASTLPVVGASGAIFGLLGPLVVNRYRALSRQGHWSARFGFLPFLAVSQIFLVALHVAFVWFELPVAWEAHLGGLLAGLALEPFLRRTPAQYRAAAKSVRPSPFAHPPVRLRSGVPLVRRPVPGDGANL